MGPLAIATDKHLLSLLHPTKLVKSKRDSNNFIFLLKKVASKLLQIFIDGDYVNDVFDDDSI